MIFKGEKFHGLPIFGVHCLASYKSLDGGYCFSRMVVEIKSFHIFYLLDNSLISLEGVVGEMKARFFYSPKMILTKAIKLLCMSVKIHSFNGGGDYVFGGFSSY